MRASLFLLWSRALREARVAEQQKINFRTLAAALFVSRYFLYFYIVDQLAQPWGAIRADLHDLSVTVFAHLDKAVAVVEKGGLAAIGQDLFESIEPAGETALDVFQRNIVPTHCHPVTDTAEAFLQ